MKKILQCLFVLNLVCGLSACMTTQSLSIESKRNIHTISVDKNVKIPSEIYYLGPGFGYVGLLSMLPGVSSADKLKAVVFANHIQINQIVRNRFIADIQRDTHYKVADSSDGRADATLQMEVKMYGFTVPQGFSVEVVPTMTVEAKLMQGNLMIWQNHYSVLALFEGMPSYKPSELIAKPELIATSWNRAAEKVASHLVKELN